MVLPPAERADLRRAGVLLKALANPVRLGIVVHLREGAACVHELVGALGVAQPLVSQHLQVLRGARVVAATRRGKEVQYSLKDEHVGHIVDDAIRHAEERSAR